MNRRLARGDRNALLAHIAAAAGAALTVNALIGSLGWMGDQQGDLPWLPGVLVGGVWTALITGLGVAHWLVGRTSPRLADEQRNIIWLVILCLAYPFYTMGLSSAWLGLIGNLVIAYLCARIADRIAPVSKRAAVPVGLPIPWLIFATGIIVSGL
jgi:benzodiazapine receptor